MRINYNVTGTQRKELVKVIANTTGAKAEYMKMPTCNYQIDYFTVTKDGALEFDDMADSEEARKVLEAIADAGFEPEPQETAETEAEEESEEADETAQEAEETGLTVEIPLDKVAVGTLTNVLEAKGTLIKKALGIENLRFEIKEDRIAFPWFPELPSPDETRAYTMFIAQLCKLSKDLKRASSTEMPVTNEKYAFRCFLLRLGFIGAEYKQERKILLQNLEGNSSWKNGAPKKETADEATEEVQA